ncbi:family 31 glycosyl hydrolase, alpha-glucosidase [Terriglobus roseus DSM 18391]|uniref:Family 31 glycosyl hydrolase, alpha-glucosidase n=1 Tax=Terriglobus roseus (strain DSM 18391 / NRRL B-41598 / KBS 63) TaxID=926566 RepID=I3ZE67_TERRK|nr:TIM-barrel domain-containing protein [Terriglobus roseus]AFL87535.1 family 31 glycosyl hydrolase, alpha-glucosidase [Terriglobus roseus DSM 18391]
MSRCAVRLLFPTAVFLLPLAALAQQIRATPNGLTATEDGTTLEVTALQADKLRIREWRSAPPEDASWAVLPASRTSRATVAADVRGFHTDKLSVEISTGLHLIIRDHHGNVLQEDSTPVQWRGETFHIYKQRGENEHFFGLGDKPGPLDRAGQEFTMWNTDDFGWQESSDPIYKSIPFFMDVKDGRSFGILFDNTWRTSFDFGRESAQEYNFGSQGGPVDYYFLYGPEPKQVMASYAWLTGPAPLPPLWSFGFQQSRYTYSPASQLLDVAAHLRKDKIPADALWLDIDFQKNNMPFTVDPVGFPKFPELVQQLAKEHFHLIVIADTHIADKPNAGYVPYDSGTAGDHFLKNPDGTTYVGKVWPGDSVFPDYTQARTRKWFGTLYKDFVADGVSGFWDDMNEPAVFRYPSKTMPLDTQHRIDEPGFAKRTASHREVHNIYGLLNSQASYDGVLALRPNERPYVMTRATYAGGQRYAVTWTGDNSSTWNHMRMTTPQLINLGISGFSFAGADVGGFAGSPPADLLTKWLEIAAFQPIDRDHSAKGTRMHEPWVDGPEQEAIRKRFIEERYRLLPYMYTVAEETSRDGMPMMRPLFMEFPHATADGSPMDLVTGGAEFLLGSDLLIAPNPSPEEVAPYELHLPPGTWYDYWTGARAGTRSVVQTRDSEVRDSLLASQQTMLTPELAKVPVYARGGAILPLQPLVQNTDETPNGPLTLRVYVPSAGESCSGTVYSDDGHSLNYRKGDFFRMNASCSVSADGLLSVTLDPAEGRYKPWFKQLRIELVGSQRAPQRASIDGKEAALASTGAVPSITFDWNAKGSRITFQ